MWATCGRAIMSHSSSPPLSAHLISLAFQCDGVQIPVLAFWLRLHSQHLCAMWLQYVCVACQLLWHIHSLVWRSSCMPGAVLSHSGGGPWACIRSCVRLALRFSHPAPVRDKWQCVAPLGSDPPWHEATPCAQGRSQGR